MATDKLFNIVGVSKLNGEYKVRFATDIMRIKVLAKSGHEDIRLAELDAPVTKLEAAKQIALMDEFQDAAAQSTIAEYIEDKSPKAPAKAKAAPAPMSDFDEDEPPVATAPVAAPAAAAPTQKAEDILAMIRARQQK
jgi:hypothetical protein